ISKRDWSSDVCSSDLVAEEAGLNPDTIQRLHTDYLRSVAQEALADGVVTEEEQADLQAVAEILGLGGDAISAALDWARDQAPSGGRKDVVTGRGRGRG